MFDKVLNIPLIKDKIPSTIDLIKNLDFASKIAELDKKNSKDDNFNKKRNRSQSFLTKLQSNIRRTTDFRHWNN